MVRHVVMFKIVSSPFVGTFSPKTIVGDKFERRTYFGLTDEEARQWARRSADSMCEALSAEKCEVIKITRITEENIEP